VQSFRFDRFKQMVVQTASLDFRDPPVVPSVIATNVAFLVSGVRLIAEPLRVPLIPYS